MILDDEWLLRDLVTLDNEIQWQVVGVNEVSVRVIEVRKSPDFLRYSGCRCANLWLVRLAVDRGAEDLDWGLQGACEGGHRVLVDLMIEKGADHWNRGLWGACKGGHRYLVDLMIERGAHFCNEYWGCPGHEFPSRR
jgi:hypothetical protein